MLTTLRKKARPNIASAMAGDEEKAFALSLRFPHNPHQNLTVLTRRLWIAVHSELFRSNENYSLFLELISVHFFQEKTHLCFNSLVPCLGCPLCANWRQSFQSLSLYSSLRSVLSLGHSVILAYQSLFTCRLPAKVHWSSIVRRGRIFCLIYVTRVSAYGFIQVVINLD